MRDNTAVVPVRRRRSIFSIIGMIVVALVVAVVAYFAWVGWSERGRPVPDVDVKTTSSAGGTLRYAGGGNLPEGAGTEMLRYLKSNTLSVSASTRA